MWDGEEITFSDEEDKNKKTSENKNENENENNNQNQKELSKKYQPRNSPETTHKFISSLLTGAISYNLNNNEATSDPVSSPPPPPAPPSSPPTPKIPNITSTPKKSPPQPKKPINNNKLPLIRDLSDSETSENENEKNTTDDKELKKPPSPPPPQNKKEKNQPKGKKRKKIDMDEESDSDFSISSDIEKHVKNKLKHSDRIEEQKKQQKRKQASRKKKLPAKEKRKKKLKLWEEFMQKKTEENEKLPKNQRKKYDDLSALYSDEIDAENQRTEGETEKQIKKGKDPILLKTLNKIAEEDLFSDDGDTEGEDIEESDDDDEADEDDAIPLEVMENTCMHWLKKKLRMMNDALGDQGNEFIADIARKYFYARNNSKNTPNDKKRKTDRTEERKNKKQKTLSPYITTTNKDDYNLDNGNEMPALNKSPINRENSSPYNDKSTENRKNYDDADNDHYDSPPKPYYTCESDDSLGYSSDSSGYSSSSSSSSDKGEYNSHGYRHKKKKKKMSIRKRNILDKTKAIKKLCNKIKDKMNQPAKLVVNPNDIPISMDNIWKPCVSPEISRLYKLGDDESMCWACSRANENTVPIEYNEWMGLYNIFLQHHHTKKPVELAIEMWIHYEICIRQPANQRRKRNQLEIPKWGPVSIYIHITQHTIDPSILIPFYIGETGRAINVEFMNDFYEYNDPYNKVIRVRDEGLSKVERLFKIFLSLQKIDPSKLPNYNSSGLMNIKNQVSNGGSGNNNSIGWINMDRPHSTRRHPSALRSAAF